MDKYTQAAKARVDRLYIAAKDLRWYSRSATHDHRMRDAMRNAARELEDVADWLAEGLPVAHNEVSTPAA